MTVVSGVMAALLLLNLLWILIVLARSGSRRPGGFPILKLELPLQLVAVVLWAWFGVYWIGAWWGAPVLFVGGVVFTLVLGVLGHIVARMLGWPGLAALCAPVYLYGTLVVAHGAGLDLSFLLWAQAAVEHPLLAGCAVVAPGWGAFAAIHTMVSEDWDRRRANSDLLDRIRSGRS
ncbi:MAG: hypothetical protein JRI68_30700 [Deltaproteobacteria bacterium]|nr:hypothetical protein [Deltaproteobacteria bacterium]